MSAVTWQLIKLHMLLSEDEDEEGDQQEEAGDELVNPKQLQHFSKHQKAREIKWSF